MPRDLKPERGAQPGRSSKETNGGGWAGRAVVPSVQITRGMTAPASASSAARPKKKKPTPPAAAAALAPPADMPSAGSGAEELGTGSVCGTRVLRVPVCTDGIDAGAAAGRALATLLR